MTKNAYSDGSNHHNVKGNCNSVHNGTGDIKVSLVPKSITIGLAVFAFILSIAGYGFRLMVGEPWQDIALHAAVVVPVFVIVIPLLFWLGALLMNKFSRTNIARRNAFTLGWLTSCVAMLWLMGTYS